MTVFDTTTPKGGQIASRPRWRATPRASLRCLGLSALIAFAAGCSVEQQADQAFRECMSLAVGVFQAASPGTVEACRRVANDVRTQQKSRSNQSSDTTQTGVRM